MLSPQVRVTRFNVFHILLVVCLACRPIVSQLPAETLCAEGSMRPDLNDCSSYYQCLNGRVLKLKCHSGSYYESAGEVCVIDYFGVCKTARANCVEDEISRDPGNICGYLHCINGELTEVNCASGNYFDVELKMCLPDESGACSAEKCTDNAIQEDPQNSCGYLKCVDGKLLKRSCPAGSAFNMELKFCVIDEHGTCVEDCKNGELQEDHWNSCDYLQCVDEKFVQKSCAGGTYFNTQIDACVTDTEGVCAVKCTEGELLEDHWNKCGYLQCENEKLVEKNCAKGSYFNPDLKTCLIDNNGECSTKSNTGNCLDGEVDVDLEDCSGYMKCVNGEMQKDFCPDGNYFHATMKSCQLDTEGACEQTMDENCQQGTRLSDPDDCASYKECIDGDFVSKRCEDGSYFESEQAVCLEDVDNVCPPAEEDDY